MAREEAQKDVDEMTVAELRSRASELEITGRSSMNKSDLRQAVIDADAQLAAIGGNGHADQTVSEQEQASEDGGDAAVQNEDGLPPAPSIGPNTEIEYEPPEERLAKHDPSTVDAMGLDKRRSVMGQRYGASFAKQATVYGVFLAVMVALFIGAKFAIDELDQGPDTIDPEAPWSKPEAHQQPPAPIDFPRNPSQ